ncbi:MAG TPA: SDR family oxidoreductase [Gammaproteobacteria bacterium]|nr:SDR family oxidoreductase [Gammaproteobacteria bacterium]
MRFELKNKTALVTGGSQGIGKEIALQLAREGVKVALTSGNETKLKTAAAEIDAAGGTVVAIPGDARSEVDLIRVAETAQGYFGAIDILVNNVAGIGRIGNFEEMPAEEWVDLFRINVMSGVILARHLIARMKEKGWGRILFMSSERAIEPKKNLAAYSMTKAGMLALAKGLSNELGEYGITVNCISPGVIVTPSWDAGAASANMSREEFAEQYSQHVLAGDKLGMPEDVAALVCYLCSDLARWITGSNFRVDGGSIKNIQI